MRPASPTRPAGVLLLVLAGAASLATSPRLEPNASATLDGPPLVLAAGQERQVHRVRVRPADGALPLLKRGEAWRLVLNAELTPPSDWTVCDRGGDCPDAGMGIVPEPPLVQVQITPTVVDSSDPFFFRGRVETVTHVGLDVLQQPDPLTATAEFEVHFERGDRALFGAVAVEWRLDAIAPTSDGRSAALVIEVDP